MHIKANAASNYLAWGHHDMYNEDITVHFEGIDAPTHPYTCGHCSTRVSGRVIARASPDRFGRMTPILWLKCPNCGDGSVLTRDETIYPVAPFGPDIEGLPTEVSEAYEEARRCISVKAYTAAEQMCRKILMNVAVQEGAGEGESFSYYVGYLQQHSYITPNMQVWVDQIRERGNQSTHELGGPGEDRARNTLQFTAMLLRLIYETRRTYLALGLLVLVV